MSASAFYETVILAKRWGGDDALRAGAHMRACMLYWCCCATLVPPARPAWTSCRVVAAKGYDPRRSTNHRPPPPHPTTGCTAGDAGIVSGSVPGADLLRVAMETAVQQSKLGANRKVMGYYKQELKGFVAHEILAWEFPDAKPKARPSEGGR